MLYIFRVLLSGIHLMRTGEVNANLPACNREVGLPYIEELIARKMSGGEQVTLVGDEIGFYEREYLRLRERLIVESTRSMLPERATAAGALTDLLARIRLGAPVPG